MTHIFPATAYTYQTPPTKAIARQVMPEKAWAYYSSAADDEITTRENHAAYHRCFHASNMDICVFY